MRIYTTTTCFPPTLKIIISQVVLYLMRLVVNYCIIMFPFLYNSFLSPELIMLVFHLPSFLSTYYKFFPHTPPAQLKFNVNGFNLKVRDKIIYPWGQNWRVQIWEEWKTFWKLALRNTVENQLGWSEITNFIRYLPDYKSGSIPWRSSTSNQEV